MSNKSENLRTSQNISGHIGKYGKIKEYEKMIQSRRISRHNRKHEKTSDI